MLSLLPVALASLAAAALVGLPRPATARLGGLRGPRRTSWQWSGDSVRRTGRDRALTRPALTRPAVVGPVAVGAGAALVGGPALGAVAAVAGLVAVRWRAGQAEAASGREERARAVEACLALAAELAAGRSPAEALEAAAEVAAGPAGIALRRAGQAAALGGDVPGALTSVEGSAVPDLLRALAACWSVCAAAGNGLAPAVERLADGLVADAARRRAVEAELAGPRATSGLLALLPLAGIGLAAGLGADPVQVLLHTPLGMACLVVGVGLDLLGVWWTGRLVARALVA